MKLRTLGIVTLILLIAGLLWTLRPRGSQPAPVAPTPTPIVEKQVDAAPLDPTVAANPARERAQTSAVAERHTTADFALIKVLVVNKATQAPMPGIDVDCICEAVRDKLNSSTIEDTHRSHGVPFELLDTDENGHVEIEIPPGAEATVTATGMKQDFGFDRAKIPPLKAGDVHEVTLQLPTTMDMPFWMQVVDEATQAPLAGVHVIAEMLRKPPQTLTTDARGLVLFEGRTWWMSDLCIRAPQRAPLFVQPQPGHGEMQDAQVVGVPLGATLRVHVVDGAGAAVSQAHVELTTPGYNLCLRGGGASQFDAGDVTWRGDTDSSGTVTISALPPRVPLQTRITRPKKWSSDDHLVLEPGETRRVEWKLSNGCDVHGLVLDQNEKPVTDHEMWLRRADKKVRASLQSYSSDPTVTGKSDAQGRFHFDGVEPGIWWVGPSVHPPGTPLSADDVTSMAEVVEVADGQSDVDVTLHVDRGLFIRGHLLDSKGNPPSAGMVAAVEMSQHIYESASLMGGKSEFTVGPLSAGHYRLVGSSGFSAEAESLPVEADAGAENVELRMRAGASLSGRVIGVDDSPVPAKMWMTQRDSKTFGVHGVPCKKDGTFEAQGLLAGVYDIAASSTEGAVGLLEGVELKTGDSLTNLKIRLQPGGHVRVRHDGPERYANIEIITHGIVVDLEGLERGASQEFAAPAGSVIVQAAYHEGELRLAQRTVEVKAGQTVDVKFEKDAH